MQSRTKHTFLLFIVLILLCNFTFAQKPVVKQDSTQVYEDIEEFSDKSNFTKFIYKLIFKPTKQGSSKKRKYKKLIQKPYSSFEGKTIRHIHIETLDPFGYSIEDTTSVARSFIQKTGNKLHVKTQDITIQNLLLIHKNQPFDALSVKESERLVRKMDFVRDVSFYVKTASRNSDSVDIFIRVLDIWSIIPKGSMSALGTTINLTDKNFLGYGHEFQNVYSRDYNQGTNAYKAHYFIPNIKNTYINSTLLYGIVGHKYNKRSVAFDRPFFSPLAKWAAGISYSHQFRNDSISTNNIVFIPQRFKYNTQDYWAGSAIRIYKGISEYYRTTNFISTFRFLRVRYLENPIAALDPQHVYTNENFFLGSIGISTRKYAQEKYIFKFGITEDVPVGKVISLTAGYQDKSYNGRIYLGSRVSFGKYHPWGYLITNLELGTFLNGKHIEQGVITAGINYYSGLIELSNWKIRQFAKPQLTIGINRFVHDSLTINDGFGLDGFRSPTLFGTNRMLLTLQTQSYAPWDFIGFRFGPYFTWSMGMLGDKVSGFRNSKLYSQIGIGVLIRNENLVLNTFQISIAFYPSIPGIGNNITKINSFDTSDFGFRDFEIGKPAPVLYR